MQTPAAPTRSRYDGAAIAYNLVGLALLAVMIALAAAYLVDHQARQSGMAPVEAELAATITKTIAGRELRIPAGWLRKDAERVDGFAGEASLHTTLTLDGMAAAEPATIDITLISRSRLRASSTLLDAVYLHQFTDETVDGPTGLVGKPLAASSGYAGETVWYDPLAGEPFVAKCLTPVEPDTEAKCLRAVILPSGIGVLYEFDETVLAGWKGFDAAMRRLLTAIGAW